ncbi:MAG: RsmD family RNA methyltransferase, partial [Parasporobacterium sp.]|nr:RsmD family RNA methyltransferase [Parasporobacterium sp.]
EALSRGARVSFFVENNAKAVQFIRENLSFTHLEKDAVVMQKSVLSAIHELSLKQIRFDLVYMDPPYQKGFEEETLRALAYSSIIDTDTMIIIEADKNNTLSFLKDMPFEVFREKLYKTNKHVFVRLGGIKHEEKSDLSGNV